MLNPRRVSLELCAARSHSISMLIKTEDNLGFLLHDVARLYRARFDELARPLGVTRPQWRALLILSISPGMSQAALADRLEVERITLCRMVDRLEERELVERRADPSDRRVWRLHVTDKAQELVDKLSALGHHLESRVCESLGEQDTKLFRDALHQVQELLKVPSHEVVAA